MHVRSWTHDEDTPDPMLQEQFQIAMDATQIRTPELIEACRAVLVDQLPAAEVAQKHGIDPSSVYRAIATVKAKWEEICAKEEWEYVPLAFPKSIMRVMLEFERDLLARYSEQRGKGGRPK
jgi:DNA-directed RNA polymerase specialized sigma24 family protein